MKVWLADLTYTQQTIASDVVPAAVAMIGEFVRSQMADPPEIRIFKFPEDLAQALKVEMPDVLGVSNYVWNCRLSSAFCRRIKEVRPEVVTVMGGPNFPTVASEQADFLRRHPWVDYYVMKEGEVGVLRLLEHFRDNGFVPPTSSTGIPNLIYLDGNDVLVPPATVERLMDLTEIPSPYLNGGLDAFLDGRLLPVVQTNRGCPFTCTFCTEGQNYWSKVRRKDTEVIAAEIHYIAESMSKLPADRKRWDLLIADSNFAMFEEDLEVCRVIGREQAAHGYPRYVNVATGKNRKERVLEAARLVNGAMKLAGSVQSLDPVVQENIKRKNISATEIVEMALKAAEIGTNTYSEVILGLPGDTLDAHFGTLETLIESGFNTLSMYQLMILPGTELGLESTKATYGMKCRYRVLPRCFGIYEILGKRLSIAEVEEICVASKTLPYEDYLRCRKMNFIVNVFYNDGVFSELIKLLTVAGLSRWGWLKAIEECSHSPEFDRMTEDFLRETEGELWERREDVEAHTSDPAQVERYLAGEMGNNLIFRFKAISMTARFPALCDVAWGTIRDYLAAHAPDRPELAELAEEIIIFKRLQIENLFIDAQPRRREFHYDIIAFTAAAGTVDGLSISGLRRSAPATIVFSNTPEQCAMIESYVGLFGSDIPGLSRILSRVYLKQLLRQPSIQGDMP